MPAPLKHINPDPPNTSAIATCPALLEWLRCVPAEHHTDYCERADALLRACDDPAAIGAVLRIMLGERRLATWALQSERVRRISKANLRQALKGMADAERDLQRAWSDYRAAYRAALPPARQSSAGVPTADALIGKRRLPAKAGSGTPPVTTAGG